MAKRVSPKSAAEPGAVESSTPDGDVTIAVRGGGAIYYPKGQAGEYAPLAANPYWGCGHGCAYCYVPKVLGQNGMTREIFDKGAVLRKDFMKNLARDARRFQAAGITEQVFISFTSDPYHLDDTTPTRETLEILRDHGLGFCTLSKGGSRALRDLDLFRPDRDAYAATLTTLDDAFSKKWERNAALPADRIATLKKFYEAGIYTWVSLEPTLDIESSIEIVRATHGFVDLYKVGQANYLKEITKTTDWQGYTERIIELMAQLGQAHYIKKDLQPYLPEGYHNPLRVKQHHGTETMAKPRAPSPAIPITEPARVESSTSGVNAPTLAELIEAGAADANLEAGYIRHRTEESFNYWMRQAERTWYAYEVHGLRGRRSPVSNGKSFEEFAHKIGISYDVAMVLFDLHPLKSRVLAKIETDKEIADNKNKPYKYPTWRTALKWFKSEPEQEPVADDGSETPVADDLAAKNFTLAQELKAVRDHEFELTGRIKELESENADLRKKLAEKPSEAPSELPKGFPRDDTATGLTIVADRSRTLREAVTSTDFTIKGVRRSTTKRKKDDGRSP